MILWQLVKVAPPELYEIESVIKKQGDGKHLKFFVKWTDYPESQNGWVAERDILIV
jgi:hypothetical protein